MQVNENILQGSEKIIFKLRELYFSHGYKPYRMSKFEEYDLYARNKDFLVSDNVITFNDTNGKLMALKPDVTLSIIKNSADEKDAVCRVYYDENVYRVSKGTGSFSEILQTGVECFGNIDERDVTECLKLSLDSLRLLSEESALAVSDLDILENTVNALNLSSEEEKAVYKAIGEKNIPEIERMCQENGRDLLRLLSISGDIRSAEKELKYFGEQSAILKLISEIKGTEYEKFIKIDFSVIGDINYYNGIIFKGFIKGVPQNVLSGGQYDRLMQKMGKTSRAVGFAVYTDSLSRLAGEGKAEQSHGFLNIALPKGRLGEKVYEMFAKAGYECPSILEPNRKLIFENAEKGVRYFWVKPSDVAIYVERGAADVGVVGKDILLEYNPDVFELVDLKMGKCRMAVAALKDFSDTGNGTLRVATKFSQIAKDYYMSKGRDIDIIHLNGSIEIAPILGLSDVIVDIVETGRTLKENNLEVKNEILPISARFIANKASYKFKEEKIKDVEQKLFAITEEKND